VLLFWLFLVGNFGANVDDYWQFPGPFFVNVDGRTASPALIDAARWMAGHAPPETHILSTFEESGVFYGYATAVDPSFALSWQVFFSTPTVPPLFLQGIKTQRVKYIVVDYRIATMYPTAFPYFSDYEPLLQRYPPPISDLTKFNHLPWATRVFSSGPVSIFQVNDARLP
jgi:hypothetical protein